LALSRTYRHIGALLYKKEKANFEEFLATKGTQVKSSAVQHSSNPHRRMWNSTPLGSFCTSRITQIPSETVLKDSAVLAAAVSIEEYFRKKLTVE
jgi:hypothetical protein